MSQNNFRRRQSHKWLPSSAELLARSRGQWMAILSAAGMPVQFLIRRRGCPCPRCGGRDRFDLLPDFPERGAVHCRHCFTRGHDPFPGDGIATLRWWMGCDSFTARTWLAQWLGLGDSGSVVSAQKRVERRITLSQSGKTPRPIWTTLADRYWTWLTGRPDWLTRIAQTLSVSTESLNRLRVGWNEDRCATTWPMRDSAGAVTGIQLRRPATDRKTNLEGGESGLFFDLEILASNSFQRIYVAEGASDTAALLSVGLCAVGTPSAGTKRDVLAALCRRLAPHEVVIVADDDDRGRTGAKRLAQALLPVVPSVRIMFAGGFKDARKWIAAGACRYAVEAVADAAPELALSIGRAK